MWSEVLGGLLKQGTTPPQQIQVDNGKNTENLFLYGFAIVVLVIVAFIIFKTIKK